MWPHIKEFYKSPGSEEDSKGDNNDKTGETEPVKVYIFYWVLAKHGLLFRDSA